MGRLRAAGRASRSQRVQSEGRRLGEAERRSPSGKTPAGLLQGARVWGWLPPVPEVERGGAGWSREAGAGHWRPSAAEGREGGKEPARGARAGEPHGALRRQASHGRSPGPG